MNMTERNKFWDSEEATKKAAKKVVVSKDDVPNKQQREGAIAYSTKRRSGSNKSREELCQRKRK